MYYKLRVLWKNFLENKYQVNLGIEFNKRYSEEGMLDAAIDKSGIVKDRDKEKSMMATNLCLVAAFTALSIKDEMEEMVTSLEIQIEELLDSSEELLEVELEEE